MQSVYVLSVTELEICCMQSAHLLFAIVPENNNNNNNNNNKEDF